MYAANFQTENPRTCYKGEKGGKMLIESLLATKNVIMNGAFVTKLL